MYAVVTCYIGCTVLALCYICWWFIGYV